MTAREFLNFILTEVLNTFLDSVFTAINCLDLNIFIYLNFKNMLDDEETPVLAL